MLTTMTSPRPAYRRLDPPNTLMHWMTLAPELSATSSMDSIWIMSAQLLHSTLDQSRRHPALDLRQRPMLDDFDTIADMVLVVFVVRLVPRADSNVLLVLGVEL